MNPTAEIARDGATAPLKPPHLEAADSASDHHDETSSGWFEALSKPTLALPFLTIFGALLFLLNLGTYPLYTKGEPREAVTIFDIVHGGGVILPMRAGIEIPSKPLLMHWFAALLSILAGSVNEWTVRMPSALFAIGGVLVCYYYVRRLFNDRAALIAALILGTSVQYLQAGAVARVDMTLTFFMEVAFFEFLLIAEGLTRRRNLLYVAIAMAVLAKGPVGLVLPGAVALIWIAAQWRWNLLREMNLARGVLIVVILAGWWYLGAAIIGGRAFLEKQLLAENLVRFAGGANFHEGHQHAFYYLEAALLAGFMPWTPILALVAVHAARAPRVSNTRLLYILTWFLGVVIFYSFAHSKRGVYLFSAYPALATLIAIYLVDAIDQPAAGGRLVAFFSTLYGAALTLAGAAMVLGLGMLWRWPSGLASIFDLFSITDRDFINALGAAAASQSVLSIAIPIAALAVGLYLVRTSGNAYKMALGIAGGMGLLAMAANAVVVPAIANTLSLKTFATDVRKTVDDHSVGYLLDMDYDVVFYSRRNYPIVLFKDRNKPEYLLCWENIWERIPSAARNEYQVVLTSNPTDLDGSGRMLLLRKVLTPPTPSEGVEV